MYQSLHLTIPTHPTHHPTPTRSLTDADLSDVIAGRPEDEAKESLRIMAEGLSECKLRALDLSDNALGEKGIVACKAALQHMTTLESLTLQVRR